MEKESISFEDFSKMDFKVGKILGASKIKKKGKLLLLNVDLGTEVRSVVTGIAKDFSLEDLIGLDVILLCNLKSYFINGVESQGVILMTKDNNGKMIFISTDFFDQVITGLKVC